MKRLLILAICCFGLCQAELDLLIVDATIFTVDENHRVISPGFIAIERDTIHSIGKMEELDASMKAKQTLSARNKLVMPGLVNTHCQSASTLFKGLADDAFLEDWLKSVGRLERAFVTPEFVRAGCELAILEMIRSGTTTVVDTYYFADERAKAYHNAHMRAVVGNGIVDQSLIGENNTSDFLDAFEAFCAKWRQDPLIQPAIAPLSLFRCSPATIKKCKELADKWDTPMLLMLGETTAEREMAHKTWGDAPITLLEKVGALSPRLLLSHAIDITPSDLDKMQQWGVSVAHCPRSNLKLGCGVAPLHSFKKRTIAVGLGSDGAASSNGLNLFCGMQLTSSLHKGNGENPKALKSIDVTRMATIDGARAIGLDDQIGSIEAGKKADIIIISLDEPFAVPLYSLNSLLAHSMEGLAVETSIIGGRIVMLERQMLNLNARDIMNRARKIAATIKTSLLEKKI